MDYQAARQRFAQRLREVRTSRAFTQEQLAELIGKSTEHISYLERGERSPSFEVLIDLARVLSTSVDALVGEVPETSKIIESLAVAPVSEPLPEPAAEQTASSEERRSDLDRLNAALEGVIEMQNLANEYGIRDVFQDNGGKVLQLLILLGLRSAPGREGNDAVDEEGDEYELKTVNRSLNKNAGITTHHHLN